VQLPAPHKEIRVESLGLAPPGGNRSLLQRVNFTISAGQVLAVVGPSGSGKSSLARALGGVWRPARGHVKLDGASLDQWSPDWLGGTWDTCRKT
jgi:ATP-binding cassette subfamily C protein